MDTIPAVDTMRISQLATRTGVPATTLRYYESAGLLPAGRTAAGYRVYGQDAVDRLAFIVAAKHLGLSLDEIVELLTVWEAADCRAVKADLRPRVAARLAAAEERAAELASFGASLRTALARLDALPDRPGRCDPSCGFLEPAPWAGTEGGTTPATEEPAPATEPDPATEPAPATEREPAPPVARAPIACSLTGGGRTERAADWRRLLDGARRAPLPGGLRLTLPADRAGALAELAVAERECCPFFEFRVLFDGPVVRLEVRAPAEAAELLAALLAPDGDGGTDAGDADDADDADDAGEGRPATRSGPRGGG